MQGHLFRRLSSRSRLRLYLIAACEDRARKKFAILVLVEPRALEIEQRDAGQVRKRERVDRELRERLVGRRIGLVVEYVDRSVSNLDEIDVAGDDAFLAGHIRERALSPTAPRSRRFILVKPDRNLDGDGDRIVGEHEPLKCLVAELVIADGRNDQCGGVGGRVVPDVDDRVRGVGEVACGLRRAGFRVRFPAEKVVRAICRDVFEKIGERREARVAFALIVEGSGRAGIRALGDGRRSCRFGGDRA